MSEIAKALVQIQGELPGIKKDKTAKIDTKGGGNYSYKYSDLGTVSDAVLPLLAGAGLAWITMPTLLESGKFVLNYKLIHVTGEELEGNYPLNNSDRPQDQGSAITYARRYALAAVVGVVPDEDDDGHVASNRPKTVNLASYIKEALTPREIEMLRENWRADGYNFKTTAVPEHREQEIRTLVDSFVGMEAQEDDEMAAALDPNR